MQILSGTAWKNFDFSDKYDSAQTVRLAAIAANWLDDPASLADAKSLLSSL